MINKLLAIILLLTVGLFFTPISIWDGPVVIEAMGYRISTNTLVIAGVFVALLLVFRLIAAIPRSISSYYHQRCVKGQVVIMQGVITAIYNHQPKDAAKLISKLDGNAAVKILRLRVMQMKNMKMETLIQELEAMLADKDCQIFALEELIKIYISRKDWLLVVEAANKLWQLYPSLWLLSVKMFALSELKMWEEAIALSEQAKRSGVLDKRVLSQLRNILFYKMGQSLQEVDLNKSIKALEEAMDMESIQPYILMIEMQIKSGDINQACYYAKKAWKRFPDCRVAGLILSLEKHLSPKKLYNVCRDIASTNKGDYESLLLMAEAAMLIDDMVEANSLLQQALVITHDRRVYILLARCCHLMHGNVTEIYGWLNKACSFPIVTKYGGVCWDLLEMKYSEVDSNMVIHIN